MKGLKSVMVCCACLLGSSLMGANPYFQQLYQRVHSNIEAGAYEENMLLTDSLATDTLFQTLNCYQKGQIYHKLGVSFYLSNQEARALHIFLEEVLIRWDDCPDVPLSEKANTVYNVGICYQYLDQLELARSYLDEALYIFEEDPSYPPEKLAAKYYGAGNFYRDIYDGFRAKINYQHALALYQKVPGSYNEQVNLYNDLLVLDLNQKKHEEALGYVRQGLAIYQKAPAEISSFHLAMIFLNAGTLFLEQTQLDSAWFYSGKALLHIDLPTMPLYYSIVLELRAMILGEKGRMKEATALLNQVIEIRQRELGSPDSYRSLAVGYENLSELFLKMGHITQAVEAIESGLRLIEVGTQSAAQTGSVSQRVARDPLLFIRLLNLKAKCLADQGTNQSSLIQAQNIHHQIDTLIHQSILSFDFEGSQLTYLELVHGYYQGAIENALRLYREYGHTAALYDAAYFTFRTKALVFQYHLQQSQALERLVDPALRDREKQLKTHFLSLQQLLVDQKEPHLQDSLLGAYLQAQRDFEYFLKEVALSHPNYYQRKYAQISPPSVRQLQTSLEPNNCMVAFFQGMDSIYSFWISPDTCFPVSHAYPISLQEKVQDFSAACSEPGNPFPDSLAYFLYRQLIQPGIKKMRQGIRQMYILPDGQLYTFPFEALLTDPEASGDFLIRKMSISYGYTPNMLIQQGPLQRNLRYVGFGTSYSNKLQSRYLKNRYLQPSALLGPLSLSTKEIQRANDIFKGEVFAGKDANLDNFYRYSAEADILHLSLHGLADTENPGRSCILFDDHHEDFILSAMDLYTHAIPAQLVILSACHTANGRLYEGEGIKGMSKAFLLSGASSVIASVWNATESSSLPVLTSFLQEIKQGKPKDQALQSAKLAYLQESPPSQRHPYYWANFVLIGNPNEVILKQTSPWLSGFGAVFLLSLSALFLIWFGRGRRVKRAPSNGAS